MNVSLKDVVLALALLLYLVFGQQNVAQAVCMPGDTGCEIVEPQPLPKLYLPLVVVG